MSSIATIGPTTGGAGTATVTTSILYSGGDFPATTPAIPLNTMNNPHSPQQSPQLVNLASGNNTIAVPAGTGAAVIELPTTNTATVSVSTVSLAAAERIAPNGVETRTFDPAAIPSDLYIVAGAAVNGVKIYWV